MAGSGQSRGRPPHHNHYRATQHPSARSMRNVMRGEQSYILQFSDSLTARKCALRIDPQDSRLPLTGLLDKYLKNCPIQSLQRESRLTEDSASVLQDLQDFVYISSNTGQLHGMYAGVSFSQRGGTLDTDAAPQTESTKVGETEIAVIDILVDRSNIGYDRNWEGFHRRRWDRHPDLYSSFVSESLLRDYSDAETDSILALSTTDQKIKLVRSLSKRIWDSEFENYSRFIGHKLPYKTGDETVRNILEGGGGICSEKVQALKFLTDHYGIGSEYLLAGADTPSPAPEEKLRELLTTFDFRFAKRFMRYWQHTALLYEINGTRILVDATNGNIPFLFLTDGDAQRILGYEDKSPVAVRMAVHEEDFYYHRVAQDIPENLYFAMEGWIPDVDLTQVFDNELGLYISSDFFVSPIVYKSAAGYDRLRRQYLQVCARAGLECSVSDDWTLDSPLGRRLLGRAPEAAEKITISRSHLILRYDECHGSGHDGGLVIINLRRNGDDSPAPR